MAESSFSRLDHRAPLPQATVRQVGSGWNSTGAVDRADATTYLPISLAGDAPAPQPVEPPPEPSEQELRGDLAQRILAMQFSNAQLERATATHQRATAYVERCRAHLQTFDNLDDEAAAAAIVALSSDAGRIDPADDGMRKRRIERDVARDAVTAATRATAVLAEALAEAGDDAAKAATVTRRAAVAVAAMIAERLAQKVVDLEDEAKRIRERVYGFDRIAAGTGQLPLPPALRDVIWSDQTHQLRPIDSSAWRSAIDQLLGDAQAEVSVPIPPRRPKPVLQHSDEVRRAIPIRRAEPVEEESGTPLPEPTAAAEE